MANAPLSGETGKLVKVICPTAQARIFRVKAGRPNRFECIFEFAFWRSHQNDGHSEPAV
jgi:hypothetical protein